MNHYKLLNNTRARDRAILIGLLRVGIPMQVRRLDRRNAPWLPVEPRHIEFGIKHLHANNLKPHLWKRRYEK